MRTSKPRGRAAPRVKLVGRAIAVTVAAAVLYGVFLGLTDVSKLRDALAGFAWWTLGAALALVLVGYVMRALRWKLYLGRLGVTSPFWESTLVFLSGFAMGVTPGKMGEVVKAYYLAERRGTSYDASVPAVVAERVADVVAVALLFAVGILVAGATWGLVAGILVLAAVALGVIALRSSVVAAALLRIAGRVPILKRAVPSLTRMHSNLAPLLGGQILATAVLLSVGAWTLEATAMWALARGFGLDLSLAQCAFVFAAATLAGVLTFLPGGLGVTEGGMIVLLQQLGAPPASATALTLAIRLCTLWFGVVVGAIAIVLLRALPARGAPRPGSLK